MANKRTPKMCPCGRGYKTERVRHRDSTVEGTLNVCSACAEEILEERRREERDL